MSFNAGVRSIASSKRQYVTILAAVLWVRQIVGVLFRDADANVEQPHEPPFREVACDDFGSASPTAPPSSTACTT
jgi:hypothetical protein